MCDSPQLVDANCEFSIMARSHNFSSDEMHALLSCLESMKGLIMADGGPEYKTAEEQRKGWEYIACIVNSVGDGTERSAKTVKNKWVDLKYRTKKKVAMYNRKVRNGDVTPALKLNDIEERVLKLIGKGASGNTSFSAFAEELSETRDMSEGDSNFSDDSSVEFEDKHLVTSSEVGLQGSLKKLRASEDFKLKYSSSTERVRRHRLKIQSQHKDNIEDFISTQKKTYDSMKNIETRTQEGIQHEKIIIKNQEKIINRLDSMVMLMSDLNGHMENLNDSLNILTQVIATKSGIEIVENE